MSESATVQIKSHLYLWWAEIAVERCAEARQARDRSEPGGESQSLSQESRAAMTAICASAFSVEALILELAPVALPQSFRDAWYGGDGRAAKVTSRLRETLKLSLALRGAAVEVLVSSMEPVITRRSKAVHFEGEFADAAAHPSGTSTSVEHVEYSVENAEAAKRALFAIFQAVIDHPKPAILDWSRAHAGVLQTLMAAGHL